MAGHRSATRFKLNRRAIWMATLTAPTGLLAVAAVLTPVPSEPPVSPSPATELLAEAVTSDPAAEAKEPQQVAYLTSQSTTAETTPAPVPRPESLPSEVGRGGVPDINYTAYKHAEELLAVQQPQCRIGWTLIAGIGRVESTHANHGAARVDGDLLVPVLGPVLDGSLSGTAVIKDTDGGELDGDPNYDRAVGPTQFLPETWKAYGTDGNGYGNIDPQNLFDAALTTGNYLCHGNLDLSNAEDIAKAVLHYDNSQAYVNEVLSFAQQYASH